MVEVPDKEQAERIARAIAKKDPEFAREQFNREIDDRRWMDAAGTFMVALYHRAVALMETEDFGIQWQAPPDDGFGVILGIVAALSKVVEEQGDSAPFKLLIALEAFSSIARTQAIIEGRDPDCEEEGGQLIRLARTWADEERKAGRNPQLPATDTGIKEGLKRMEKAGSLVIPGRSKGENDEAAGA